MAATRSDPEALLELADQLAEVASLGALVRTLASHFQRVAVWLVSDTGVALSIHAEGDIPNAELGAALSAWSSTDADTTLTLTSGVFRVVALGAATAPRGFLAFEVGSDPQSEALEATVRRHASAALERILATEALTRPAEYLEAVVENTPNVAIQGYDLEGRVQWWNRAAERMFGYTAEEAVGKKLDALMLDAASAREFEQALARIAETGEPSGPSEWQLSRRDGSTAQVYSTIFAVPTRDGAKRFVCMDVDITARKRAEQELRESQSRLMQAQKLEAVGRLASGVAHDFNNMLAAVQGNADLLRARLEPEHPAQANVREIIDVVQHASTLSRRLLAFSRRQPATPRLLDLNELVRGMLPMLDRLIGDQIQLQPAFSAMLWPVKADPSLLEQVVLNLFVNARDAMPNGGNLGIVTENFTSSGSSTELPAGEFVALHVQDDGEGMTEHTRAHLFEPFFTTKPEGTGSGLGLATAYWVVTQSGGHVLVDSAPGRGATFSVLLPRASGGVDRKHPETSSESVHRGRGELLLVVENEPAVRRAQVEILERHGYSVIIADDGLSARGILAVRSDVRAVVTDVRMPHVSGTELAREAAHLPFVFVSAERADQALEETGRGIWVLKPYSASALLDAVHQALGRFTKG